MTVQNNGITPDVEDFVPFVGYPNSLEYKNRWAGGEPVVCHYNFNYNDVELNRDAVLGGLINEHGARFVAFEFLYFSNKELDDSQSSAFKNFLDYIHNPKTDTIDCFDVPRIFFHKIVRNKFILGKGKGLEFNCFNSIPLIEFLYITVDPEFTRKVQPNAIKFKGFFAIRSLVGQENDRPVLLTLTMVKGYFKDARVWEVKGNEEAEKYGASLMLSAMNNPKEGLAHTAAFHAFHGFRNYNKGCDDDPIYDDLLGYVDGMFQYHNREPAPPFAYMSHRPLGNYQFINYFGPYPEDIKNDEIPGIYVQNSYDHPALLLHLFKVYILLKKIRLVNGIGYEPINDCFLSPLGPNDGFEQNIYGILAYLRFKTRGALMGLDIPRLLCAQLNNAMKLLKLDPKFLLLPI